MTPKDELELILKLIRKYDLPLSPILEYAIREKSDALADYPILCESTTEDEATNCINKQDSNIILIHPVDWSSFEYGFTIDNKFHEAIFAAVGKYIPRGSGVDVKIIFQGKVLDAKITNANCQGRNGDTIRLLYKGKSNTLGSYLKEILPEIYNYIKAFKEVNGGRKQCHIPSEMHKLLVMKQTESPNTFNIFIESC